MAEVERRAVAVRQNMARLRALREEREAQPLPSPAPESSKTKGARKQTKRR